jgi:exopolysaccharide production protein ExoQ
MHSSEHSSEKTFERSFSFPVSKKERFCIVFIGSIALMVLLSAFFPRFLAYGPGLIAVISAGFFPSAMGEKFSLSKPAFIIAGTTVFLAAISSLWAIDSSEAIERSIRMSFILLPGALLFSIAQSVPINSVRPYLWIVATAAALGSLVITADILLDFPLYRLTRGLTASDKVKDAVANRSVVTMTLVMLPSTFWIYDWLQRNNHKNSFLYAFIYAALFMPMLVITDSQTAQAGIIIALLFLVAFPYKVRGVWLGLKAAIISLLAAAPWLAIWMYNNLPQHLERGGLVKRASILHRMEIWDFVSRHALQNPFYGFGIEATKAVESFDTRMRFWPGDHVIHPHNFSIQLWMEFGIIGVFFAGALFFYIIHVIQKHVPLAASRFILPTFMLWLSVAAFGYGMWQGWWLGLSCLVLALAVLSGNLQKHAPPPPGK